MKKALLVFFVYFILCIPLNQGFSKNSETFQEKKIADTTKVAELNKAGYNNRLIDPEQTISYSLKALKLAQSLNYIDGIAEAYRIKGIGKFYVNESDSAMQSFLTSLSYFEQKQNREGIAKVYNNIGNLYRNVDYDRGLEYFQKSLTIAQQLNIKDLIAGLYLNMGTIYQKKGKLNLSLKYFEKSYGLFNKLNIPDGVMQCFQNLSIVYKDLNQLEKAEQYACKAIAKAKENDRNMTIASTNLTLSAVYIMQDRFDEAEKAIIEGVTYSKLLDDEKLEYDFLYNSFTLENKRQNYHKALDYLKKVYSIDSTNYNNNVSTRIGLLQEQLTKKTREQENQLLKAKQKNNTILIWSSILVSSLLIMVIGLLISNVRKKAYTNKQLTALNQEISLQKENLDRINHNLEDIIDDRTKDLKIKNKKLSDYSSHLSHQIRGPIATLKGLMNLQKENLIDDEEFINQMEKCVNDIDDKILNINEMLHDPQKYGFRND